MSSENSLEPPSGSKYRQKPASRGGPSILSILALILALATAGYVIYRDPPWGRLSKYDFSSPEQALRSDLRMEANGDILALIELNSKLDKRQSKEKMSTLDVKRTVQFDGKTGLFIQYTQTDKKTKKESERKSVVWYEKDEPSGYWRETHVSSMEIAQKDEKLAKEVEEWNRGQFGLPGIGN